MLQQLRALTVLENLGFIPSLKTVRNSTSNGYETLFWAPRALLARSWASPQ